jgi:hypothetical protein
MENGMSASDKQPLVSFLKGMQLKKLTAEQIRQIDQFLDSLKGYGEIHLIVQRGVLKYINKIESHKAVKDVDKDAE